jgi:hypothetical protein
MDEQLRRRLENLFFEACPACKAAGGDICRWHKIRIPTLLDYISSFLVAEYDRGKVEAWREVRNVLDDHYYRGDQERIEALREEIRAELKSKGESNDEAS